MDERDRDCQPFRLGRNIVDTHDERQHRNDEKIDCSLDDIGPLDDLSEVCARLIEFTRTDALAHHCRKAEVDGLTGKAVEVAERVADGIRHHRRRAEGRDQAEKHETSQLEHSVLHAAGHADIEDVAHQAHIEPEAAHIGEVQHQLFVEEQGEDDGCRHRAGDERRDGDARDVHAYAEDEDGVARDVDAVHQQRDLERHIAPAHRAEERRAAVVERDARDGSHHI